MASELTITFGFFASTLAIASFVVVIYQYLHLLRWSKVVHDAERQTALPGHGVSTSSSFLDLGLSIDNAFDLNKSAAASTPSLALSRIRFRPRSYGGSSAKDEEALG